MAGKIRSYRDVLAWQRAMDLIVEVYRLTKTYPAEERFCLTLHTRKSSHSVPSNMAEGHSRNYTQEFLRHISIAKGSLAETETQLQIALRLDYLTGGDMETAWSLCSETGRLLNGLEASLQRRTRDS